MIQVVVNGGLCVLIYPFQLLNTFSNFGGTWPKFFVLEAVDSFTIASCSVPDADGQGNTRRRRGCVDIYLCAVDMVEFSCVEESGLTQCKELGGSCDISRDGYYIVGTACVLLGLALLQAYIRPVVRHLESLSKRSWRISR